MSALDRYDEWEQRVDELLAASSVPPPPPLEDVYDDGVLAAIDARREPPASSSALQRRVASGAMVLGLVNGVREAVDPDDDDDELVEVYEARATGRLEPVTVHLAWGEPAASVAIVRPWLF